MTTVTAAAQTQVLSTAKVVELVRVASDPNQRMGHFMASGVLHTIAQSWVSMTA